MLEYRMININRDRDILLELHCRINYESETPFARKVAYEEYRAKWLSTSQPDSYLSHLEKTMKAKRTMAEILEDDNGVVGYLWVTFTDIEGYEITIAEIMDIIVVPDRQRQGIGTKMMRYIEETARNRGATFLRSARARASKPYQIHCEKVLS